MSHFHTPTPAHKMRVPKQRDESVEAAAEAVSVGMTEGRGRGLFAARAMKAGVTVLIERCELPLS